MSTASAPILAGKYHLLRKLGSGGMAEVFLARQSGLDGFEKLVVIKRILPHLSDDDEFVTMFLDEARTAADLRHPNVVNIFEVNATGNVYYMAMEFLHGQDIRKIQKKAASRKESVPLQHTCQIIIDAATGLHYAHTKQDLSGRALNIIHRDVSPQNILVTYDGTTKIVDFGIAKASSQDAHTATGVIKGKYTYMSPEQAQGERFDHRSDQFALGIVFWELLTMRRLFKRPTEIATMNAIIDCEVPAPSMFVPDIPEHLEHIVLQCLQKSPDDRFDSAEDLALELEEFLAGEGVVHSPARVAHYMKSLFADEIAQETDLGKGTLDGASFSGLADPDGVGTRAERSTRSKANQPLEVPDEEWGEPDAMTAFSKRDAPPMHKPAPVSLPPGDAGDDEDVDGKTRTDSELSRPSRSSGANLAEFAELSEDLTSTSTPETVIERTGGLMPRVQTPDGTTRYGIVLAAAALVVVVGGLLLLGGLTLLGGTSGDVTVRSTPPGARILLDGRDTGKQTPHVFHDVARGGSHEVKLELAGYKPEVAAFSFGREARVLVDIPLEQDAHEPEPKVSGHLTGAAVPVADPVAPPPPADAPADTPADAPANAPADAPADAPAEPPKPPEVVTPPPPPPTTTTSKPATHRPAAQRAPKPARLRVVAKPWAEVLVDGKRMGETPLPPLKLAPGTYKVELRNSDLKKSETRTIKLDPGEDELIKIEW